MQVKNQGMTINIEEKVDVISQLQKGAKIDDIQHNVRYSHSGICTMYDNAD
jgi:hypothetical protein